MDARQGDIVCPAVIGASLGQAEREGKMRVLMNPTYYDYQVGAPS